MTPLSRLKSCPRPYISNSEVALAPMHFCRIHTPLVPGSSNADGRCPNLARRFELPPKPNSYQDFSSALASGILPKCHGKSPIDASSQLAVIYCIHRSPHRHDPTALPDGASYMLPYHLLLCKHLNQNTVSQPCSAQHHNPHLSLSLSLSPLSSTS